MCFELNLSMERVWSALKIGSRLHCGHKRIEII